MEEKRIEDELIYPFLLANRLRLAVKEADVFQQECTNIGNYANSLSDKLNLLLRFTGSLQSFYDRPVRRIVPEVAKNLERALYLVKKCKRSRGLRSIVTIISLTEFKKVQSLLEASVSDVKWLGSILCVGRSEDFGIDLTIPPIASNDPILAWVWSFISFLHTNSLNEKTEAANYLAQLANDNDRNKQFIVEEDGVGPLLKLLKEGVSEEAQIAAGTALLYLANDGERVRAIVSEQGVSVIVKVLSDSPVEVQNLMANLIAKMARHDQIAQDDFSRENVTRPFVTLLSFETVSEDPTFQFDGGGF